MRVLMLPFSPRYILLTIALSGTAAAAGVAWRHPTGRRTTLCHWYSSAVLPCSGLRDLVQRRHAILRNYPYPRICASSWRTSVQELRQYFFESDKEGMPFPRDKRAIVYQRAKHELDKRPFGTHYDVYRTEYEWLHHSMAPKPVAKEPFRILIGGRECRQLYSASVFNISAMSFGSISANAIRSLNRGARLGGFAHDTGEGGFSPYHRENGGDIVWEIGTGYFGCRDRAGAFSPERFAETAAAEQIKMIEIKLSQGAKPGLGGILPAAKVTGEIARIRLVEKGRDCVSPARHAAFATPIQMMHFIAELRALSGGKPTGFKLCVGHPWEFMALLKGMLETGITPDFIVVDGTEGGTGAAPLEFIDHMGMPLRDGLAFVHSALVGARPARAHPPRGVRQRSPPPSTWPAPWRSAPTGATRRAASCSPSAASRRRPATRAIARRALPRRTRPASGRSSFPTSRRAWRAFTSRPSRRSPSSSPLPVSPTRPSCGRTTSCAAPHPTGS